MTDYIFFGYSIKMRLVLVSKVLYKLYHFPVAGQNLATAAERLSSIVLVKHFDLGALQETWLFPWDLPVPSTLGIDVNSFSLSSIDVTNGIRPGHPYGGITFIWH